MNSLNQKNSQGSLLYVYASVISICAFIVINKWKSLLLIIHYLCIAYAFKKNTYQMYPKNLGRFRHVGTINTPTHSNTFARSPLIYQRHFERNVNIYVQCMGR